MFELVELMAVVASATFGVLLARRKQLDVVGVFSVAFITAFGGGTIRDLLLDRRPLFWIGESHYPLIVFGLSIVGSWLPTLDDARLRRWLVVPDALGLGLFTVVGTGYALDAGVSWFIASLFGVMTGTFGGVAGDVICNEIPSLFRQSPLCATCAFVGSWVYLLGTRTTLHEPFIVSAAIGVVVLFRLLAVRFDWTLPSAKREAPDDAAKPRRS